MKLAIGENEYDINDALQKATLADLYQLKLRTGIGMKTLQASLVAMADLVDPMDFLDSEPILLALNALVWLCRRRAGEVLSIEQANAFPADELRLLADPADDEAGEDDADPTTAQTVTDLGAVDAEPVEPQN